MGRFTATRAVPPTGSGSSAFAGRDGAGATAGAGR